MLSKELCAMIYKFLRDNPSLVCPQNTNLVLSPSNLLFQDIDYRIIRLVALSYYHNVWVPILALDT